jgi:acetyl-CoA C-acetyltransferase
MKVYIVAAKRTAIGKFLGSLSGFGAGELGAIVIKALLKETNIDAKSVEQVIVGNVLSAGQGQGIARQAALKAGIPDSVPAYGIDMVCGSGMKTVMLGFTEIAAGNADIVIAGGIESMSNTPFMLGSALRNGQKMGDFKAIDHMVFDGLTDVFNNYHMGITAENVAEKYAISRQAQDDFAFQSQQKAIKAVDSGAFANEIVPVEIVSKKETVVFDKDEYPNRASTPEKLAALKPAFKKDGTVTAGNASGVNDGASFVILMSENKVKELGIKPLAEIIACGQGGVSPEVMGLGPVPAIRQALKKANMNLQQIDVMELNEAFAAQSLGVVEELSSEHGVAKEWILNRTNLNGGAIALGHPIGASGNRIIVTLVHEMKRSNKEFGLASLCIGGGMGTAVILKNV